MDCETVERRYLNRREAAIYAGVGERTIDRWIATGRLRVTAPPFRRTTREWIDAALDPKGS